MNQALSSFLAENHKPKAIQKKDQKAKGTITSNSIKPKAGTTAISSQSIRLKFILLSFSLNFQFGTQIKSIPANIQAGSIVDGGFELIA